MRFFSTGHFRGLIAQILGTIVGMAFVMAVRVVMRLPLDLSDPKVFEPVMVVGVIFGALAFLIGVGSFDGWFNWARGQATSDDISPDPAKPNWMRYFSVDYDHKVIGIQYGVTSFFLLGFGGLMAIFFRTELAQSGIEFLKNGSIFEILLSKPWQVLAGQQYSPEHMFNTMMS